MQELIEQLRRDIESYMHEFDAAPGTIENWPDNEPDYALFTKKFTNFSSSDFHFQH